MKKICSFWSALFLIVISTFGQIPTNGLVGWWAFNGNANDLSGLGNNGTVIGTPIFMTDRFGQQNAAIDLDLSQVQVPDAASLDLTSDFTITLWAQIKINYISCGGTTCILKILDKGNSYGIQHTNQTPGGNPTNNRYLGFTNLNSGNACAIDNFHNLPIMPTWEFVAYKIQWNSIYNDFDRWLYINAQYVTNNYCNTPPQANSNDLIFGSLWARPLDDIRIYNRALSHEEIIAIYNETPPTVTIDSPNGYESWVVGTTQNITWTSSGCNNLKIEYTSDNGTTWNLIVDNFPAINGSYNWVIPNTPSNLCRVRITDDDNLNASDESNNLFSIVAEANILVQIPNGGEIWMAGTDQQIWWTSTGISYVNIDFTTDNGNNWLPIFPNSPSGVNNMALWPVPSTPSNQCRIRISDVSNPSVQDQSDNVFTITENPNLGITVISPNGNEIWQVGLPYYIIWNGSNVSNVRIDYSIDNGISWIILEYSFPANVGQYLWTVPNTPTTNCLVKISDASNSPFYDVSDNKFTITPYTSIEELREQVKICPNPTNGQIRIQSDKIIRNIIIYNSMGIQVLTLKSENSEMTLNLSNFGKGVYYLKMNIDDRTDVHKVVVL